MSTMTPEITEKRNPNLVEFWPSARDDKATILMLPGLFADASLWNGIFRQLLELGYGMIIVVSPLASIVAADGRARIDSLAQFVINAMNKKNIHQVTVCGNSVGASLALYLAARYPDRFAGVIASGAPGFGEITNLGINLFGPLTREIAMSLADKLILNQSGLSNELIDTIFEYVSDPRNRRNMVSLINEVKKQDTIAMVQPITADVFLLWGQHDIVTPVAVWEKHLSLIPHARLEIIPDAAHSPNFDQPDRFFNRMRFFLEREEWAGTVALADSRSAMM